MVQLDPQGVEILWTKGAKKNTKQKVSKLDADYLIKSGWAKSLDDPPKDKAVKAPPKKK